MFKKPLKKRDLILLMLVLAVILITGLFYFTTKRIGNVIRVIRDNEIIDTIPLSEDISKTYTFNEEENVLVIENGKADVVSANCKNQICVNSEPIDEVGETITCLPHKLIFEVVEE